VWLPARYGGDGESGTKPTGDERRRGGSQPPARVRPSFSAVDLTHSLERHRRWQAASAVPWPDAARPRHRPVA
jgi:hypothetical protein